MKRSHQKVLIPFVFIIMVSLLLLGKIYADTLTVELVVNPNTTDIFAGSRQIALTAKASGTNLTFKWELLGPGEFKGRTTGSAVFYVPPEKIDGESEQAIISIQVSNDKGQEVADSIVFNILAEIVPTPTPIMVTPTPPPPTPIIGPKDCESVTADGEPIELYSVSGRDWSKEWRTWWWAQIAFKEAKKAGSKEVLIHQIMISQDVHCFYRFGTEKDAILYESKVPKDSIIEIGSCWKAVYESGPKVDVDKYGTRHETEKLTIYILQQ